MGTQEMDNVGKGLMCGAAVDCDAGQPSNEARSIEQMLV